MKATLTISMFWLSLMGSIVCGQESDNLKTDKVCSELSDVSEKFSLSTIAANLKKEDPLHTLELLRNHLSGKYGMQAVGYINRVAELHPKPEVRQKVVDIFVTQYNGHQGVGRRCYEYLLADYQANDFSECSKDVIRQKLHKDVTSETIRLTGVANMQEEISQLNEIIVEGRKEREKLKPIEIPWLFTKMWDACLAKARMGSKEDIDECVSKIKEEVGSNPRFSVCLLDDLGYIRRPESVELLKEYFLSDCKLPATEVEEPFSRYLMPIMQQNLIGFPEFRDVENLRHATSEEIENCKAWVKKQTEFKIKR